MNKERCDGMKQKNVSYEELMALLKTYITDDKSLSLIDKAYNMVKEKHEGEKRLTGDPYINHFVSVSYILAEIKADAETICGAMLHESLKNKDLTLEEIEKEYNHNIALLVDGVTKLNNLTLTGDNEAVQIKEEIP